MGGWKLRQIGVKAMPRPKTKEYDLFQCKLDKKISQALTEFCEETGRTKTSAVERALVKYLEEYKKTGKS